MTITKLLYKKKDYVSVNKHKVDRQYNFLNFIRDYVKNIRKLDDKAIKVFGQRIFRDDLLRIDLFSEEEALKNAKAEDNGKYKWIEIQLKKEGLNKHFRLFRVEPTKSEIMRYRGISKGVRGEAILEMPIFYGIILKPKK